MWVIYSLNCKTLKVSVLCYCDDYESALDAVDDYAEAAFLRKVPSWDKKTMGRPLDAEVAPKDGYHVMLDKDSVNLNKDAERVLLYKMTGGKGKLLRYWQFARADKYIGDYLDERTAKVVELEQDEIVPVPHIRDNVTRAENDQDSDESSSSDEEDGKRTADSDEDSE
jgi:hypothetical protein